MFGLILEEQSDQDLHCLFSYVGGCSCRLFSLISACLLGNADPGQTDPRGTV